VAVGTFPGKVLWVDPASNERGEFRVMISAPEGESWPDVSYLRQGVRSLAWISIKTVALGYELWRQFNAFPIAPETIAGGSGSAKKEKSQ
jgi:hypothetical protein